MPPIFLISDLLSFLFIFLGRYEAHQLSITASGTSTGKWQRALQVSHVYVVEEGEGESVSQIHGVRGRRSGRGEREFMSSVRGGMR